MGTGACGSKGVVMRGGVVDGVRNRTRYMLGPTSVASRRAGDIGGW